MGRLRQRVWRLSGRMRAQLSHCVTSEYRALVSFEVLEADLEPLHMEKARSHDGVHIDQNLVYPTLIWGLLSIEVAEQ